MRIVILLPDLRGGGAERISITLAQEFQRLGHSPEFVLMQAKGEFISEAKALFPIHDLGCQRFRSVLPALTKYLREHRPDALLAAMWPLTVIAPLAQKLSGHPCPVVISEHNNLSLQYQDWGTLHQVMLRSSVSLGYRLATARVGVSQGVVKDMSKLSGLATEEMTVIYNPIAVASEPSPAAIEQVEKLWGAPRGERILTVGTLKPQKNHALLLQAFARLCRTSARLMIVGRGELEKQLQQLALELGIMEQVIFAGFHRDPAPFYATADLFVLSSDYEGFGNVIVEALGQGLPVVSTDCPAGPSEILEGGRWGQLVPVGDVAALAKAMENALEMAHDRTALKQRAKDFDPAIAAKRYLHLMGVS